MKQIVILISLTLFSCVSLDKSKQPEVPKITEKTPLDEAIGAAIDHGGKTLKDTLKLIAYRQEWAKATTIIEKSVLEGIIHYSNLQLVNAVHLYQKTPEKIKPFVFVSLVSAERRPLAVQLGWQLAAARPSAEIKTAMETEMTNAIENGEDKKLQMTQVAHAVASNRLFSAYSVLKQGLMVTGHESFATAMIALNPQKASDDFLDYLALAPVEELRQINVTTVKIVTGGIILNHLTKYPPQVGHRHFDMIYLYAVSRNVGLADGAHMALMAQMPENDKVLATKLVRLPIWVQVAFLEGAKRRMSTVMTRFIQEFQKVASSPEVISEVASVLKTQL